MRSWLARPADRPVNSAPCNCLVDWPGSTQDKGEPDEDHQSCGNDFAHRWTTSHHWRGHHIWHREPAAADEKIVVPDDAAFLAGDDVNGPFSAYAQADIISTHALAASEGKTYAELGELAGKATADGDEELAAQYQGQRDTVMQASFLRASLFTSVLAFGVAAMVIGLGVMFGLLGWALMSIRPAVVHTDATPEHAAL